MQKSFWKFLNTFLGKWNSEVNGKAGLGKRIREYLNIIQGNFFHYNNKTILNLKRKILKGKFMKTGDSSVMIQ